MTTKASMIVPYIYMTKIAIDKKDIRISPNTTNVSTLLELAVLILLERYIEAATTSALR
jgi:hypothetical protein